MRYKALNLPSILLILASLLLGGCFTGIESTKKIKLSREDLKALQPTPEERFLSEIHPVPHTDWLPGRQFVVVGDKCSVLFEPRKILSGDYRLNVGDTILFLGSQINRLPDGTSAPLLLFARGKDEFSFATRSKSEPVKSDAIPGVIDSEMLAEVQRIMIGKTLWTRNSTRDNETSGMSDGKKFEEVTVTDVKPGNMIFPMRVMIVNKEGEPSSIFMNFGNGGKDSRSFANMFMLENPRKNYSAISDSVWSNIMSGIVEIGMTKEECRLSKGNPEEVSNGHDYQHTLLIWNYSDGTVLYFVDGLLQGINSKPKMN